MVQVKRELGIPAGHGSNRAAYLIKQEPPGVEMGDVKEGARRFMFGTRR